MTQQLDNELMCYANYKLAKMVHSEVVSLDVRYQDVVYSHNIHQLWYLNKWYLSILKFISFSVSQIPYVFSGDW